MRTIGKCAKSVQKFSSYTALPAPVSQNSYDKINDKILRVTTVVANSCMKKAAKEEELLTGTSDIMVTGDGTWKNRGRSSLVGVPQTDRTCFKKNTLLAENDSIPHLPLGSSNRRNVFCCTPPLVETIPFHAIWPLWSHSTVTERFKKIPLLKTIQIHAICLKVTFLTDGTCFKKIPLAETDSISMPSAFRLHIQQTERKFSKKNTFQLKRLKSMLSAFKVTSQQRERVSKENTL
ncbi:hypothetical protein AVEN_183141-1 [Araneus ventricosus]|uniref:Uncharacterized protein n=1 Tax=Araneus ventricosus TaxID=182803 RepID=A0A4Y2IMP4_ARAVE|nr:hypothetical protein AVEN_183141-1 [Araneus ventricosus]